MHISKQNVIKIIQFGALFAAVLYSAWLVGYFVNPDVAWRGTASELAATGQPWRSFFVGMDIVTSVILICTALLLLSLVVKKPRQNLIVALYVVFSCCVFLTAVFSLQCAGAQEVCEMPGYKERLVIHMSVGICGLLSLFIGSLLAIKQAPTTLASKVSIYILWVGIIMGAISVLSSWELFNSRVTSIVQRIFLLVASYAIWLIPHMLIKSLDSESFNEEKIHIALPKE